MRFGDSVWYCSKLKEPDENGQEFAPPKEIKTGIMHFTVMSRSATSALIDFGDDTDEKLRCIAQPYRAWAGVFKAGDLFYCNGATSCARCRLSAQACSAIRRRRAARPPRCRIRLMRS